MDTSLRSLLHELERFGEDNDARAHRRQEKMLNITSETGELLAILVRATKARRVLEIGTSNGYSTLWLAEAVRSGFDLVFLDADREQYLAWWPGIDAVLAAGGLLVVDNAVSHAQEMEAFLAAVRRAAGYRGCLVPVDNGEFLAVELVQEQVLA